MPDVFLLVFEGVATYLGSLRPAEAGRNQDLKSTKTSRVTIATVMFLIVALNSPPSTPSIPTDLSVPPSPEEVKVLEELLDWVRAGRKEDPSGAFSLGDIASAIRERPRSFELFRRANSESDQLRVLATLPFGAEIERAAARYQVDGLLIAAMIKAESSFNPQAVSPVGALGLMQLMPDTADPYGMSDVFDPGTNIRIGTHYISRQLRQFDGNLELALAAYNAGPGNVARFGGVPPFRETRRYVHRVLTAYYELHQRAWVESGATDWLL